MPVPTPPAYTREAAVEIVIGEQQGAEQREDEGYQHRERSLGQYKPSRGFDFSRIGVAGAVDQARHEHQQLLPHLVVHGVLGG